MDWTNPLQKWAGWWDSSWKMHGAEAYVAVVLLLLVTFYASRRVMMAFVTWRALAVTPAFSRYLSRCVRSLDYSEAEFVRADGAAGRWPEIRREALNRLSRFFQSRSAKSIAWGNRIRDSFSDLRFTDANRVPFPFMRLMREKFNLCSVVTAAEGPRLLDLDGNWCLDVSGSYGLNVAGFDQYKEWMRKGLDNVKDLGSVLGPLHPIVADNIERIKSISKLDEVSFHMSGTEAVMAAVRLARFNTRKKYIVCFSGAYHGWWDGVQPGLGSERTITDCLTLKDLNPASLNLIHRRAHEIAGVLVNPVQSFHPNMPPPSDTTLITSGIRKTSDSTSTYAQWLRSLREVCSASGVPLIFDEVLSGFRLAPGGAQEYFGIQADMVIYGKTIAGGMPIGVVCGKKELMRRFDPVRPMRIAYVIGTFSAHPVVMGAMSEFLRWISQPHAAELYAAATTRCENWIRATNQRLNALSLPIQVMNLATIWTVLFKQPGRYNWLLQYYLRARGVMLSWVGTGRCMSSLDFSEQDYDELTAKLVEAAQEMKQDGWWLNEQELPQRDSIMRFNLAKEIARSILQVPKPVQSFYVEVMQRKHDDHLASHSRLINQLLHLLSSSTFIFCYFWAFLNLTGAMCLGLIALFVRQFGHALLEPPCHDKEKALLGFNTRNKSLIVGGYILIPILHIIYAKSASLTALRDMLPEIAWQWFLLTLAAVLGRVLYLMWRYDFRTSMVWFIKLISDPITDLGAYYRTAFKPLQFIAKSREEAF